jgi:hypothetical protein
MNTTLTQNETECGKNRNTCSTSNSIIARRVKYAKRNFMYDEAKSAL